MRVSNSGPEVDTRDSVLLFGRSLASIRSLLFQNVQQSAAIAADEHGLETTGGTGLQRDGRFGDSGPIREAGDGGHIRLAGFGGGPDPQRQGRSGRRLDDTRNSVTVCFRCHLEPDQDTIVDRAEPAAGD